MDGACDDTPHIRVHKRDEVLEALFRAHFVDGEVVDDVDVLVKVAAEVGLDPESTRAALDGDDPAGEAAADAVAADLFDARRIGVQGVPFFVANRAVAVSGAQPVDVFRQFLRRAVDDVTVKL